MKANQGSMSEDFIQCMKTNQWRMSERPSTVDIGFYLFLSVFIYYTNMLTPPARAVSTRYLHQWQAPGYVLGTYMHDPRNIRDQLSDGKRMILREYNVSNVTAE